MERQRWEPLGKGISVLVSKEHSFNTDTLLLADFAMPRPSANCADFGTGCGTIPLLWAMRSRPKSITAVELQEKAFLQATASAEAGGFSSIRVIMEDVRNYRSLFPKQNLDLIACNPPYKAKNSGIKSREESLLIARHEEELSLSQLGEAAAFSLKFGGRLCICQRPERLAEAMARFSAKGLEPKRLRLVQQRPNKAPFLFLLECRRGGKPGLQVLPTLFIEGPNGGFSKEMLDIYGDYSTPKERESD